MNKQRLQRAMDLAMLSELRRQRDMALATRASHEAKQCEQRLMKIGLDFAQHRDGMSSALSRQEGLSPGLLSLWAQEIRSAENLRREAETEAVSAEAAACHRMQAAHASKSLHERVGGNLRRERKRFADQLDIEAGLTFSSRPAGNDS